MQFSKYTISHISVQPGWCGNDGMRPSVHERISQTRLILDSAVQCLFITNEQNKSYASELGMT